MDVWQKGRAEVDALLAVGRVERVPANLAAAEVLIARARIRRMRNAGDYLDDLPALPSDVRADLPGCAAIVDAAEKVLGQMPLYGAVAVRAQGR